MNDPRSYFEKKVEVKDIHGNRLVGFVDSYAYAKDNDGQDAITLNTGVWLDAYEIESIKIID